MSTQTTYLSKDATRPRALIRSKPTSGVTRPNPQTGNPPIRVDLQFFNYTNHPVTVSTRDGVVANFAPTPKQGEGNAFLIRRLVTATVDVKNDMAGLLSTVPADFTDLEVLRHMLVTETQQRPYNNSTLTLDYRIELATLLEQGGTIYDAVTDVQLSLGDVLETPPHPFSERGIMVGASMLDTPRQNTFASSRLLIVDSKSILGERYANFHGKVIKVPKIKESFMADGLYCFVTEGVTLSNPSGVSHSIVYPLDEIPDTFGIYKSFEEASCYGNTDLKKREEIAALEHKLAVSRADNQRLDELLRAQREKDKLMMEQHSDRLELARQERKLQFEEKSYVMKESSELIKYVPAVIAGIGAGYMAGRKFGWW